MATAVKKRTGNAGVKISGANLSAKSAKRAYPPEELRVRAAVESHLPSVRDVIRSYEVDFRENFAGEPAVYVTLRIPRPDDAEPKRIKRILKFWNQVSQEILDQDATFFPYVKLRGLTRV